MRKIVLGPGVLVDIDDIFLFNLKDNKIRTVLNTVTFSTNKEAENKFNYLINEYMDSLNLIEFAPTTWIARDKIKGTDIETIEEGCLKITTVYKGIIYFKNLDCNSWVIKGKTEDEIVQQLDIFNEKIIKSYSLDKK